MVYDCRNLSFGYMNMADDYAVIVCNEGSDISYKEILEINTALRERYKGKKISLVSHRFHHYSVNPAAIKKLFSEEYILAGYIVGYSEITEITANLETKYVKEKPITYLTNINEAFRRVKAVV